MSDRTIKGALIISLLANAFLAAAVVAGGIYLAGVLKEHANLRQHTPLGIFARELDPKTRDQLHQAMSGPALAADPDFKAAHAARKHAAELSVAPTVDEQAIDAELASAREAENRGRAKIEAGFVAFLKTQPQSVRVVLAKVIQGRNPMRMNHRPHPPEGGGPPPDAQGPHP